MAANNKTVVTVSADATGYNAELTKAAKSADAFATANERASARTAAAQQAVAEATANGSQASARAINSFIASLDRQAAAIGKTPAQLAEQKAAMLGVSGTAAAYIAQIDAASKHTHSFSLESTSARRELLVLAHELSQGNYTKFGGSLLVLGEATGAASLLFSALGIAALSTVAIIAGLGYQVLTGAAAFNELNKQASLTNNYLGITRSGFADLAAAATPAGTSIKTTEEAMAALVGSGKIAADQIQLATQVTTEFAKDTGQEIDKAAESLIKFAEDPQKALNELQAQYHLFSAAQVEVIQHYIDIGDKSDAYVAILHGMDEAHARFKQTGEQNVGYVTRLWESLKNAVVSAANAIANVGVSATNEQKLSQAIKVQADLQAAADRAVKEGGVNIYKSRIDEAAKAVAAAQAVVDADNKTAKAAKDRAAGGDAATAVNAYVRSDKYRTPAQRKTLDLQNEDAAFNDAVGKLDAAGLGKASAEYEQALQRHYSNVKQINDQYTKSLPKSGDDPIADQMKALSAQLQARQTELGNTLQHIKSLEQQGVIDAKTSLAEQYDARADAYKDELAFANKEIDLAGHEKSKKALAEWQAKRAAILALILQNASQYTDGIAKLQAKEDAGVKSYTDSLNAALAAREEAIDAQGQGRTLGATDADALTRSAAAAKDYATKYAELQKKFDGPGQQDTDQYKAELAALQQYETQRLKLEDEATAKIKAMNADAYGGAQKAIADAAESAGNIFQQTNGLVTDFLKNSEDAFVNLATTGKLSFSSLATSIVADLARIAVKALELQAIQGIGSLLGSLFGSTSVTGGLGTVTGSTFTGATSYTQGVSAYGSFGGSAVPTFADGGHINGPGTGTSDSIAAWLSNGEFVVNADSTQKYRGLLEAINNGGTVNRLHRYATGGYVGGAAGSVASPGVNLATNLTIKGGGDAATNKRNAVSVQKELNATIDARIQKSKQQGGAVWKLVNGVAG